MLCKMYRYAGIELTRPSPYEELKERFFEASRKCATGYRSRYFQRIIDANSPYLKRFIFTHWVDCILENSMRSDNSMMEYELLDNRMIQLFSKWQEFAYKDFEVFDQGKEFHQVTDKAINDWYDGLRPHPDFYRFLYDLTSDKGRCGPIDLDSRLIVENLHRFEGLWPKTNGTLEKAHLIHQVHEDQSCIEVSSAPTKSWRRVKKFFTTVDGILDEIGFLRHSDYILGTGGHIHVNVDACEAFIIKQHMLNHPWAMMAFADPYDDLNCRLENLPNREIRRAMDECAHLLYRNLDRVFKRAPVCKEIRNKLSICYVKKSTAVAARLKSEPIGYLKSPFSVEFRLFDVAQTWEMQEEHMAFAQAFTEYAIKTPVPKKLMTAGDVNALTQKQAVAGFKRLIHTLGLPWERYRAYAEENIKVRFWAKTENICKLDDYLINPWMLSTSLKDFPEIRDPQ